jgi:TatD DNase family protein
MRLPQPGDYIDFHTHSGKEIPGVVFIENIMAHEGITPEDCGEYLCTFGIHPWYLNENNGDQLLKKVNLLAGSANMIAIGEAGYDKLRGASMELQRKFFDGQVIIAEKVGKPVVVHCVRAWDELLASYKRLEPVMPWLIHGFRGSVGLAEQLLSKGMYLSFWFDFVIRPESADLLRALPKDKIFLETDGADIDIREIYKKVARDLDLSVDELKMVIMENFMRIFSPHPDN